MISRGSLELLKRRLPLALHRDGHAGADGSYWIRSLYFDDTEHSAFWEKLDGVKERSKYRIRYYDFDDSYIILEKKERMGELCRKTAQRVSRETAERLAQGGPAEADAPLCREFDALRASRGLRPTVIVDYRRWPFYSNVSNTRVTLDAELSTPVWSLDFFNRELAVFPVFEPDEALVEFKYDGFPPPFAAMLLEGIPKSREAVSKYAMCLAMHEK